MKNLLTIIGGVAVVAILFTLVMNQLKREERSTSDSWSSSSGSSTPPTPRAVYNILNCSAEDTGFLGLGDDKIVHVTMENVGDVLGTVQPTVTIHYPGGGAETFDGSMISIPPGGKRRRDVRIRPKAGATTYDCVVTPQ